MIVSGALNIISRITQIALISIGALSGRAGKEQMTKEELSLLLFLETCCVDYGGRVDSRRMNKADFDIVDNWKQDGYLLFGRIRHSDISADRSHWTEFSDRAWNDAHAERKARFKRINDKRQWEKTEEARQKVLL